jgi:hypothetical protein
LEAIKNTTTQAAIGQLIDAQAKIRRITKLFSFQAKTNDAFANGRKYRCKSRLFG